MALVIRLWSRAVHAGVIAVIGQAAGVTVVFPRCRSGASTSSSSSSSSSSCASAGSFAIPVPVVPSSGLNLLNFRLHLCNLNQTCVHLRGELGISCD